MTTLTRATSRIETKILTECDEAESFCSMLTFYLQDKAHWKSNGYAAILMAGISDLIDETRFGIEQSRQGALQDAHDTAGDMERSAAE